ncbi:MAG: isocitrate lyase/PEP mutase family protein [Marinomonas sp.]
MANPAFKQKLDQGAFFAVPGIHDMIAAVIANKIGFDLIYGSGYWLTASAHGIPDAGIATYTQMVDRMQTLAKTSNAALIADADTGYGGLLNVHHTVKGYEAAGVCGIQLEDQEFPKKCGHTPHRRVIDIGTAAQKIAVASDAREDKENCLIIARTDARQAEGFDAVLRRLEAYSKAGADVLFPEALESEEEMAKACAYFDAPVMANMATGGATPILPAATLAELGMAFAIYPALSSLSAATAIENTLRQLKETGSGEGPELFDFQEFCSLIGFEDVWEFEKKWPQL